MCFINYSDKVKNRKVVFIIKQIFEDHWNKFLLDNPNIKIGDGVYSNVNRILKCKTPLLVFSLFVCEHCGKQKIVLHTCKSRMCSSCGNKYIKQRESSIFSKLIKCNHRHVVFNIPKELRIFFLKDRKRLNYLFKAVSITVNYWIKDKYKKKDLIPAYVSILHTFCRSLVFNPHIHMILLDGGISNKCNEFIKISFFSYLSFRKRFMKALLDMLEEDIGKITFRKIKNQVYLSHKEDKIDIYSDNYRTVIDEKINELTSKMYDFSNPLLIYNAYGTNSSSINIYFNTDEESYLRYTIKCDDKDIDEYSKTLYDNTINNNLTTNHAYQITGLVAGKTQTISLELYNKNNEKINSKNITIFMPSSSVDIKLDVTNGESKENLQDGLYALLGHDKSFNSNIYLYDNDGILRSEIPLNSYRSDRIIMIDNNILYSYTNRKFALVNNLGKVIKTYKIDGYYMHHDFIYDENTNNLLILVNKDNADTIEDKVISLNINDGTQKEIIDMMDYAKEFYDTAVAPECGNTYGGDELDWVHLNSLSLNGTDLILSSREFSTIFCIENIYDNPTLKYVIGDESIYEGTELEKYAYNKIGDFISQAGQHSITYELDNSLENGKYYITMYNNNFASSRTRPNFNWEPFVGTGTYTEGDASKYYKYLIDENNKTFTLVDSFNTDYSSIVSNIQQVSSNILTSSGMDNSFSEYDSNHTLIRKFNYSSKKYAYRVFKYSFNNFWYF